MENRKKKVFFNFIVLILIIFVIIITYIALFCNRLGKQKKFKIVTTTTMLYDLVHNLVKDEKDIDVVCLMDVGIDPHNYKPRLSDRFHVKNADLIIINGLHLEAQMQNAFGKLIKDQTKIFYAGQYLKKQPNTELIYDNDSRLPDPHIWFDIELWQKVLIGIKEKIKDKLDNISINRIDDNYTDYKRKLETFKNTIQEVELKKLNQHKTYYLITAHDAFSYFCKFLNNLDVMKKKNTKIELKTIQGITTQSEVSIHDINNLLEIIEKNKVKVIFTESSISNQSILSLQQKAKQKKLDIEICNNNLYSDSLNENKNYIETFEHNIKNIVEKLK